MFFGELQSLFVVPFDTTYTAQKLSFALRISPVNVTKSAASCEFGQIYWGNP